MLKYNVYHIEFLCLLKKISRQIFRVFFLPPTSPPTPPLHHPTVPYSTLQHLYGTSIVLVQHLYSTPTALQHPEYPSTPVSKPYVWDGFPIHTAAHKVGINRLFIRWLRQYGFFLSEKVSSRNLPRRSISMTL